MILSDLEVHREQTAGAAKYFGTDSPEVLADHLVRQNRDTGPVPVRNLVPELDDRVATFAGDLARTIRQTLRSQRERKA
jgi:hypothetical protein